MTPLLHHTRCALACLGAVLLAHAAYAQHDEARLGEAIAAHRAADYETAIVGFDALVEDEAADKEVKKEALQWLGRTYAARNAWDDARLALLKLLELEPPLVELRGEAPPLQNLFYEVRAEYVGSYVVEREDPGMKTLAVMDFANNSVDEKERFDPMQGGFADRLVNHLHGATNLKVVERDRIQWLLGELELQRDASVVDQQTAVETGRLLGVTAVLFGSFTIFGKDMWLSARLVKVETGEILFSEQVEGRWRDFADLAGALSERVADAIDVELAEQGGSGATRSADAMLAYSEGLSLIDQERYQEAYDKFIEALEHDPGYTRARERADSLRLLLG
ncbi:MAG: CsgG/HfaB family protein [Bacteroidota bacterium]